MLDATDDLPEWTAFHHAMGGAIAELRLQYPAVRVYGEMVDILWQRGEQQAAIRLEEFWNELGKLQTFSLLCAYGIDTLEAGSYGAALDAVCRCHTHLIPTRDYARFNEAVNEFENELILQALQRTDGNKNRAATLLNLNRTTLVEKLKRKGLRLAS